MRSRYVAYALGEWDYLMDTTHPEGPIYRADRDAWREELRSFTTNTLFERLEVLGSGEDGDRGWVAFRAHLSQGDGDASFGERSRFDRVDGRWLYHSGETSA
jgi:SEC-C motif-containing protein